MPADTAPSPEHAALHGAGLHRTALRVAGLDPERAERIGEGWFAVAYRDRDRVARVLKPQTAVAGWTERYASEVRLLRMLERRGLPVPRDARAVRDAAGRLLATTHRYIEGSTARELRLRGRAHDRLAEQLADFLTELHATPLDEVRATGIQSIDLATELYAPLVAEALPLLGPRSACWVQQRLEQFTAAGGSTRAARVLVHGDLGDPHIFTDSRGSLRGVIDFGDALIADAAFDFAGLGDFSWRFAERVLAEYQGAAAADPDLPRRASFYIDVAPLYALVYGARLEDPGLLTRGRRQLAARAAAATRAAR